MAVIRYKNPSDYAFLEWMSNFPKSHHPLDTERFYVFVKTVGRFRNKRWRSFEYFKQRILDHGANFDQDEIEYFWHRMQDLLNFYETHAKPTITDSFDKRHGIYQRGVKNNKRYEVLINQQEYFSRKGATAETLKNAMYFD
jgi:hypothetical protein